jgi:diguanylate cyclase (GGDEF)-like protein/PAS domain S-box-containing protein
VTVAYTPVGLSGWTTIREQTSDSFYGAIRKSRLSVDRALLALLALAGVALTLITSRAEAVRRKTEARFRALVQNAADVVTVIAPDSTVLYESPSIERVLGYRAGSRVGTPGITYVHPDDRERALEAITNAMDGGPATVIRSELRFRHLDGHHVWLEISISNLLQDPSVRGLVANLRDVSERRAFQEELAHQAFHDALTGLPNRALFHDRLHVALHRRREPGVTVGVLFLDLDRFKVVNDSLGHEMGDKLLVGVAERLGPCLRAQDTLARLSGDEFTMLVDDVRDLGDVTQVAERVIDELRRPFCLDGREVFVGVSIGIALADAGHTPDDLIREADLAMYRAKERGRLRYEVFASDLGAQAKQRLELEAELRRAIDGDELRLHYQPEIDLATGEVAGFEALVRWEHPTRGLLAPGHFIALAEETGLIIPLGRWVLDEACRQLRSWRDDGTVSADTCLSVNVSGRQLQQHATFVASVAKVLQDHGLEPGTVKLEITESVLMEDADEVITTLQGLRTAGVALAIDDFGAGYTSLNYLKHFPVSTLKLDRSFVHGVGDDEADAAIAGAIIGLAHSLGLTVTAEGIELPGQLDQLCELGCDSGQGFHFSRPVPADQVPALLIAPIDDRRWPTRTPST